MATPTSAFFGPTGDAVIDGLTNGYYWVLNADRTVDWAIANGPAGEYWNNPAALHQYASVMLQTIAYFSNIKFNYVGYYTTPSVAYQAGAELTISLSAGTVLFPSASTWARGFFPRPTSQAVYYYGEAGDVYLNINSQANTLPSYEPGSAGWFVFLHEIGHAIGLKHPHDSGGTGRPTLAGLGLEEFDKDWASVMSYGDDFNWNLRQWDPFTPMILDVLTLQYLYGKNMVTNAGDTLLPLSRVGGYGTIWDASGNDTVTAAAAPEGWMIMLPDVQLSALVSTKAGLAVPVAEFALSSPTTMYWLAGDIENAAGSNSGDVLYGSSGNNVLSGNGGNDYLFGLSGNDTLFGGAGLDVAVYNGPSSNFSIQWLSDDNFSLRDGRGTEGYDTLIGIERLQFSASEVALDLAPNEAGGAAALLMGAVLGRQSLFARKELLGVFVDLFDAGFSMRELSGAVMRLDIWGILAGGNSSAQIATYLLTNLYGAASQAELVQAISSIDASPGDYLWHLAESSANQARINLVGLSQVGLEYL